MHRQMCDLKEILNKGVFYDVFVSWCAIRLLLLLRVCRDSKNVGKHCSRHKLYSRSIQRADCDVTGLLLQIL